MSYGDLKKVVHENLAKIIIKNREERLNLEPGFDGVYGKLKLGDDEKVVVNRSLKDF